MIGAAIVCLGLVLSLELGAWGYNLVAGVLSAMTESRTTAATDAGLDANLAQLGESPSPARRAEAADRLARSRDPRAVEGLAAALRDPDPGVQRHAALALGRVGNPAAVPALTALLRRSGDPAVRQAAATALGVLQHRQ